MNDRRHPEELISASLSGELGFEERAQLDAHLAGCAACRELRLEFAEQRRLLGGMRRQAAPRALAPRVQQAIASGAATGLPWWRSRRGILALAASGVAMLVLGVAAGLALEAGPFDRSLVGAASPSASPSVAASPSAAPGETPVPTATLASSPTHAPATPSPQSPSPAPAPQARIEPGEVAVLELSGQPGAQTFAVRNPVIQEGFPEDLGSATVVAQPSEWSGPPTHAELSPDGEWLAYQTPRGLSGITDVWVLNLVDGRVISLGETIADTPFLKRMTWSPDSQRLAYTLRATSESVMTEVWMFDSVTGDAFQLVEEGHIYAASFTPDGRLWVSVPGFAGQSAGTRSTSWLLTMTGAGPPSEPIRDVTAVSSTAIDGVFQPILSPDGRHAIFWEGWVRSDGGTQRLEGGMPYLASGAPDEPDWYGAVPLFPDLPAGRGAFASAQIAWSYNSDDFAVWNAAWTGTPIPTDQTESGEFPDVRLIYFGKVSTGQLITDYPYADLVSPRESEPPPDQSPGAVVRDVEFSPGPAGGIGVIWVTVQLPVGSDSDTPVAVLEVVPAGPSGYEPAEADPRVWRGPAVYRPEPPG